MACRGFLAGVWGSGMAASQLHCPGYQQHPNLQHASNPQTTPSYQKPWAPLCVLTKKSPCRCWGRRTDSPSAGQQMQRSHAACCLFSLCLTAALWIMLLVRLWTMRPSQETQPNIYLHCFNLKQLEEGWKPVHQHLANPTFPPARESEYCRVNENNSSALKKSVWI